MDGLGFSFDGQAGQFSGTIFSGCVNQVMPLQILFKKQKPCRGTQGLAGGQSCRGSEISVQFTVEQVA